VASDEDGRIPVKRRADLAGKGRGSGPSSLRVPFRGLDGLEEWSAVEFGSGADLQPLEQRLRRAGASRCNVCSGEGSVGACVRVEELGARGEGSRGEFTQRGAMAARRGAWTAALGLWPEGRVCDGVRGAWRTPGLGAPRLGPLDSQVMRMQRGQGAWTPVQHGGRGVATWPALKRRATWSGDGRVPAREPGPTGIVVRPKVCRPGGNADGVTSRPERADTQKFFRVALLDWFK
jgi:hypothetical protein